MAYKCPACNTRRHTALRQVSYSGTGKSIMKKTIYQCCNEYCSGSWLSLEQVIRQKAEPLDEALRSNDIRKTVRLQEVPQNAVLLGEVVQKRQASLAVRRTTPLAASRLKKSGFACPFCNTLVGRRTSRQITATAKENDYECTNAACMATFVTVEVLAYEISPPRSMPKGLYIPRCTEDVVLELTSECAPELITGLAA
jgi:hypothetical protein